MRLEFLLELSSVLPVVLDGIEVETDLSMADLLCASIRTAIPVNRVSNERLNDLHIGVILVVLKVDITSSAPSLYNYVFAHKTTSLN